LKCNDCGCAMPNDATKCRCGWEVNAISGGNRTKPFPKPKKYCQWENGPNQNCPMWSGANNAQTHGRWYCRFHARQQGEEAVKFWYWLDGKLKGRSNDLSKYLVSTFHQASYWDHNNVLHVDWEVLAKLRMKTPQWVVDGLKTMENILEKDTKDHEKIFITFGD